MKGLRKLFDLRCGNQLCLIFRRAQVKIVWLTTRKSVVLDFWVRSSEILFLRDARFTRHFHERNPVYNWELPVYKKWWSLVTNYSPFLFICPEFTNILWPYFFQNTLAWLISQYENMKLV